MDQDSRIWLANMGPQPIKIEENEVVAMAECVTEGPGTSPGDDRNCGDEVSRLVERAAPHLTDEECEQLPAGTCSRQGRSRADRHSETPDKHGDQPAIKQQVRRYPAVHREEERQLVEDMLAIGNIQESNSAWSRQTVLVKKKDGMSRFCIDYQRLNQVTKVDTYPLPHIKVNTPATFETLMERVLRGIAWSGCLVYLDDILVYGLDFATTLGRLEIVLDWLGTAGLKLKAKKCQLFQEEIPFLGHIVSAAGIGADPAKCRQVQDWPVPKDLYEVRRSSDYARTTEDIFRVLRSWLPPCMNCRSKN